MNIIYTWNVTGLRTTTVGNTENVVVQTYWKKIGIDEDGNEGYFEGATPFSADTIPEGQSFVPFDNLSEETVLGWIQSTVIGQYEEHVNKQIQNLINDKKFPVIESNLPWV